MIYITLLDQFHPGIYSSQVIDVCDYLNKKHKANIRLVAFLSIKELLRTDAKKKIKQLSPGAIVFPAFPGLKNFEWTWMFLFFICLFTGQRTAICRNAFCTKMALRVKQIGLLKKVVMDGRSALSAEIGEYDVFPIDYLRKNIRRIEGFAVNNSDFRLSVSTQLVKYWKENFAYKAGKEVIIPCTLDNKFFSDDDFLLSPNTTHIRKELGLEDSDIVLVYSGSTAPWQSFALLDKTLTPLLEADKRVKILFLSKENKDNIDFRERYNGRIFIKWLDHHEVLSYLHCCDYGILLREQSDTNKVASPVKFAEYLYAGLPVLISDSLGDFSEYVRRNNCGNVLDEKNADWSFLKKSSPFVKEQCFNLAKNSFLKEASVNDNAYKKLIECINS